MANLTDNSWDQSKSVGSTSGFCGTILQTPQTWYPRRYTATKKTVTTTYEYYKDGSIRKMTVVEETEPVVDISSYPYYTTWNGTNVEVTN